jgi:hypothetical protein
VRHRLERLQLCSLAFQLAQLLGRLQRAKDHAPQRAVDFNRNPHCCVPPRESPNTRFRTISKTIAGKMWFASANASSQTIPVDPIGRGRLAFAMSEHARFDRLTNVSDHRLVRNVPDRLLQRVDDVAGNLTPTARFALEALFGRELRVSSG